MDTVFSDAMVDAFEATEGLLTTRGTYTPAGGPPQANVLGLLRRLDLHVPTGFTGAQRRGWSLCLPVAVVPVQPTDGATFTADGVTVTIRAATYDTHKTRWECEADDA